MTTATTLETIFILLAVFQLKHFVADFPLQFPYMLRKFRPGWDFVPPLALHCLVHAVLTFVICLIFSPHLWWLSLLDFVTHFVMDRIKASPKYLGRFNNVQTTAYWSSFGLDQMVHHLTHIYIVWVIATEKFWF